MNEQLKRRFTGLALIILVLFLLSWVLPKPGEPPPTGDNVQRVTLDLQVSEAQSDVLSPVSTPVPSAIEAPRLVDPIQAEKAAVSVEPDIEESPLPELTSSVSPKPALVAPTIAKPITKNPPKTGVVTAPKSISKSSQTHWYVQLGAFSDVTNARQLLQRYKAQKFPGILSPADTPKGARYRVRIGPYAKRETAMEAQNRMVKAGATGTTLVEE